MASPWNRSKGRLPIGGSMQNVSSNMRVYFAQSMRNYMAPVYQKIFSEVTEATEQQIDAICRKFITHSWKSLASTAGGNFENFSIVQNNPNLPFDLNAASVTLGNAVDGSLLGEKNAKGAGVIRKVPNALTAAFMNHMGDFYTVNMNVPTHLKNLYANAKGDNAQGDYIRKSRGLIEIFEYKTGETHLEMKDQEEQQLKKIRDTIFGWYDATGQARPVIKLYYCCNLAENASNYYGTHRSQAIHYLTAPGLSRVLGVSLAQLQGRPRANYTPRITSFIKQINERVKAMFQPDNAPTAAQLRGLDLQALGLNIPSNLPANFEKGKSFIARRASVIAQLISVENMEDHFPPRPATGGYEQYMTDIKVMMQGLIWILSHDQGDKSANTPRVLIPAKRAELKARYKYYERELVAVGGVAPTVQAMAPSSSALKIYYAFPEFCAAREVYLRKIGVIKNSNTNHGLVEGVDVIVPTEFSAGDMEVINGLTNARGDVQAKIAAALQKINPLIRGHITPTARGRKTIEALIEILHRRGGGNARRNEPSQGSEISGLGIRITNWGKGVEVHGPLPPGLEVTAAGRRGMTPKPGRGGKGVTPKPGRGQGGNAGAGRYHPYAEAQGLAARTAAQAVRTANFRREEARLEAMLAKAE